MDQLNRGYPEAQPLPNTHSFHGSSYVPTFRNNIVFHSKKKLIKVNL